MPSDDGTPVALTIADDAADWLRRHTAGLRPQTVLQYRQVLARTLIAACGAQPIALLDLATFRAVVEATSRCGHAPATVTVAQAVLALLGDDLVRRGILPRNPARGLRRRRVRGRHGYIYDERQLSLFLASATTATPALAPIFTTCARAGLRIGETLALRPSDVDLPGRHLRVERTLLRDSTLGPPKSGSRVVDLSAHLSRVLAQLDRTPAAPWLFPSRVRRGPIAYGTARSGMKVAADAAHLPATNPHALRHAYASILVARGVSLEYVRRQLGHTSIAMTVDLYGRHIPMLPPRDLDEL